MSIKISRILHAGYIFEAGQTKLAFDPIFENPFSVNCFAFPDVSFDLESIRKLKFDAVFISHYHEDHCSLESLDLLDRKTPIYMYSVFEEIFELIRELGFESVTPMQIGEVVRVGEWQIIPKLALDPDIDCVFHIKARDLNILNVVDAWVDPNAMTELAKLAPWDMVLWPFQTMRELAVLNGAPAEPAPEIPEEWTRQLKLLKPRYIVPSSCQFRHENWSWYNQALFPITYKKFETTMNVELPEAQVLRLNPGVSVVLDKNEVQISAPLPWVQPRGEQNVDYDYAEGNAPPPTSEIAKNFPALGEEQTERVLSYCRQGILAKYPTLEFSEPFESAQRWDLNLFDHLGQVLTFSYIIEGKDIKFMHRDIGFDKPFWTTEVPISKLYGALERGESLTSMYMRVSGADALEDPLIRCLFNGSFGAYQKAQLARLV